MNVTVFGSGYVGLVQAAVLAHSGHKVVCVDIDAAKVDMLNAEIIPIYEPGLEDLVKEGQADGNLVFTTDVAMGVTHGYVQFIAVGTPPDEDGSADMQYVLAVARSIGSAMKNEVIVVTKSTVPVGTSDKVRQTISQTLAERSRRDLPFEVVSNPEFLKEGSAVADCMRPDRIILGTESSKAETVMRELYAPFNHNHDRIVVMDVRSAELTKYSANCLLATKISFMNEMAMLAERLGANIEHVRVGIGSDPRIGYDFIYPGLGYGGSCFPKDVRALIRTADLIGCDTAILKAVEERNRRQKSVLFRKVVERYGEDLSGRTFALWGLSFKPNTDDMREAPSRHLMEALWKAGASVQAYDPEAMVTTRTIYGDRDDLILCDSKEAALHNADALLIATEWKTFRVPRFEQILASLKEPVIFDGRNLYDPNMMREHGIEYHSIGRKPVPSPLQIVHQPERLAAQ